MTDVNCFEHTHTHIQIHVYTLSRMSLKDAHPSHLSQPPIDRVCEISCSCALLGLA